MITVLTTTNKNNYEIVITSINFVLIKHGILTCPVKNCVLDLFLFDSVFYANGHQLLNLLSRSYIPIYRDILCKNLTNLEIVCLRV